MGGGGGAQGKILSTPMHFIGHGRGTVVNSEIIQRLGTFFPGAGYPGGSPSGGGDTQAGNPGIHMTTLDIQDGNQASLNVDIVDVADKLLKAMEKVAALFGKKGVKAVQKFHKAMKNGREWCRGRGCQYVEL